MEWLLPCWWSPPADPTASWGTDGPPAANRGIGSDDLDVAAALYEVLVELAPCSVCGAPLGPAVHVERCRRFLTVRIVVTTCCRGPRRHRHEATVVERAGGLLTGRLRPRLNGRKS